MIYKKDDKVFVDWKRLFISPFNQIWLTLRLMFNINRWEYWEVRGRLKYPHPGHEDYEHTFGVMNRKCKITGEIQHHMERLTMSSNHNDWLSRFLNGDGDEWDEGVFKHNGEIPVFFSHCNECFEARNKEKINQIEKDLL